MLNKSSWIHTTFNWFCLIGSGLCLTAIADAQVQRTAVAGQQPTGGQPNVGQPNVGQPGSGTKVQSKQLQQMFQAQSAQNQAQAVAKQAAAAGQSANPQQQLPPGQVPGQPVMRQQAGQVQPGQIQPGQIQQGQPGQGLPGQPGQAQSAAGQPNVGQNANLTPEQIAAIEQAQQQALAAGVVNPVPPFEPLNQQWQAFLDQVLTKWEAESSKVEKFQCEFKRFQYDPTIVSPDHYTVAQGELKYLKPDKGLLKVNTLGFHAGKDEKGQAKYATNPKRQFGEYWICDGQNVYDMNRNDKVCTIFQLPPAMRGAGIQASPLPFVFGVKKQELEARYWIKPLPQPKDRPNEIWLEVYPRRADDAANYVKLQVVLDLKDWMPMGLIVFGTQWSPQSQHRELYQFDKRVVNATNILPQIFQKEFIPAKPPADWKVIEEKYQEPQAEKPSDQPRVAIPPQPGAPVVK